MKICINSVQDIIQILDFTIQNGALYNPYTASKIISQKENITVLRTASEWAAMGVTLLDGATPIAVPLPISEAYVIKGSKSINAMQLSDEEKKLMLSGNLSFEEKIIYYDFTMFDVFDTDFPQSEIDSLFEELNFIDIAMGKILLIVESYFKKCKIVVVEKPLSRYGLTSFADVESNTLYLEKKSAEAMIDVFISFLFEKTSTQNKDVEKLELFLTIYIIHHSLSLSITVSQYAQLKNQIQICIEGNELNISNSITRAFTVADFVISAFKDEYNQMPSEEELNDISPQIFYNKSIFNNIKETKE